jgi:predicted phage-related endonuclease
MDRSVNATRIVIADRRLFHSVLCLIFSCADLVAGEIDAVEQNAGRCSAAHRDKLKRTAQGLRALGFLAWIIERARDDEEHAIPPKAKEMLVSDLLLFPSSIAEIDSHPVRRDAPLTSSAFAWPRLEGLRLSAERLDARNRGIGGSDANIILSGDDEKVLRLWQEKRGEAEPEDLSGKLSVVLGCWTEDLNRQWYEKLSGKRVMDAGRVMTCSEYRWRKCTVDGVIESGGAIFEAKHTNSFVKAEDVLERYMPQLQHNMAVARAERAVLSVIFGNAKYEMFEVGADWLYQLDLLKAEKAFWSAVLSGEPPATVTPPPAPRPIATRELSFEGNNAWASAAADWLETSKAAKTHASATKNLKELLEDDVRRGFGHGVEAKRSKAGAITIKELK